MNIIELKQKQYNSADNKFMEIYVQLDNLLKELKNKELPHIVIQSINQEIEVINSTTITNNELRKLVKQKQTKIIQLLEKELKIVTKNYYRNLWLVLGMSAFGLPIGVAFGLSVDNIGLLGIGLPIGMFIGIVLGTQMDKKALKEGRQLNIEIKY